MSSARPRVGVFGGSFDPPHLGHLVVAEALRDAYALDRVLWMPAWRAPHKADRRQADPAHRLAMARLATQDHPAFEVSELELERGGVSYTVDTLETLTDTRPDAELFLMVGADSLAGFDTWRAPERILELATLLVYPRPDVHARIPEGVDAARVRIAAAPRFDVSSSDVRARIGRGESIRYLVPDAVRAYIEQHGLYA